MMNLKCQIKQPVFEYSSAAANLVQTYAQILRQSLLAMRNAFNDLPTLSCLLFAIFVTSRPGPQVNA